MDVITVNHAPRMQMIIMLTNNLMKGYSRMRFASAIVVLSAILGVLALWAFGGNIGWASASALLSVGLCVVALVWVMLRHRQRRRLMDMRDSALW